MGGRGRGQMTFSVEVVGIGRGEVLPPPTLQPPPLYPVLRNVSAQKLEAFTQRIERTSEMSSAHKLEAFRQPIGHNPVGVLKVNLVAIVILSRGKCGLSTCTTPLPGGHGSGRSTHPDHRCHFVSAPISFLSLEYPVHHPCVQCFRCAEVCSHRLFCLVHRHFHL
ncbi:uncharacterized protein LOC144612395 [Rhinoraja longicauda]